MNDEDIKTIEQLIDKCKNCTLQECINCEINYNQVQAIEKLLKENEELMKLKNDHNYSVDVVRENTKLRYELFHSVSVTKVEEKIEKLDKEEKQQLKGTKGQDRYAIKQEFMYKRNILQELLEVK